MSYEKESQRLFGGQSLPAGTYFIHSAFCGTDKLKDASGIKTYDTIEVRVFDANGQVLPATLRLNGCWRARKGTDGKAYSAEGKFYDTLKKHCMLKTYSETRDYINSTLCGYEIVLTYRQYPAERGFGNVPTVNINSNRLAVPALPAGWEPLRANLDGTVASATPAPAAPPTAGAAAAPAAGPAPSDDIPF